MRRFLCGILALTLLVSSLVGCSNDERPNNSESYSTEVNECAIVLKEVASDISPVIESIVGDIEYWPGSVADEDEFTVYYSYENKLYYSTIKVGRNTVINHGLVCTEKVFDIEGAPAYLVDGASIAKITEIDYIDRSTFIDRMGYTFEEVRNKAALDISQSFIENLYGNKDASTEVSSDNTSPTLEDVFAQPPAEWEEMPLHKCINCGGTARLTSGAWCCDNCAAVYGEEDFAEKVSLDAFAEGTWWDTYSQRCNLTIDVIDDETIAIEINWSSSASENTKWIITAKWDSYWGLLRYENGVKQNISEAGTTVGYEDGSGFFYINSGNLYWVDYKESAGFDCIFEFPIY